MPGEGSRLGAGRVRQAGQETLRQQAGVLSVEAEEEPIEEVGDLLRIIPTYLEAAGELGEAARRFLGQLGRGDVGAEGLRILEDRAQDPQGLGRVG